MEIDIVEQRIKDLSPALLKILLSDKTTKKSIRWGTDNYNEYGYRVLYRSRNNA